MNDRQKRFAGKKVVVTGAGRDFGRTCALMTAQEGAELFLSARRLETAEATAATIRDGSGAVSYPFACDMAQPDEVRAFAAAIAERTDAIDILILNAARWQEGEELTELDDPDVLDTINSTLSGSILITKALLPLLRKSAAADVVAMISSCGEKNFLDSPAHPSFYAAKHGMAGFCDIMAKRLAPEGIRVTGFFPPDFYNADPGSSDWDADDPHQGMLTARSIWETMSFLLTMPRTCHVSAIYFRGPRWDEIDEPA